MDLLYNPMHRQASTGGSIPLQKDSSSYVSLLETRLMLVERHLSELLNWRNAITSAATGKLPDTPIPSPKAKSKLEPRVAVKVHKEALKATAATSVIQVATQEIDLEPPVLDLKISVVPESKERRRTVPHIKEIEIKAESATLDDVSTKVAYDILNVIAQYGRHLYSSSHSGDSESWLGKSTFVQRVRSQVEKNEPIRMILPAFPWKSVSSSQSLEVISLKIAQINKVDKVTGILPDLGELLALARLNQLCEDVRKVYPAGGEVTIATDGLVFDDIVGIPDEDTWAYSAALMAMAAENGFNNIKLLRVMDLLGLMSGKTMTKETYMSLTAASRTMLLDQYGRTEEEVREMMQTDNDTLLTYRGFIRFLETDLKYSPIAKQAPSGSQFRKCLKKVATGMMIRAESFTKLIQARCPEYVRLSIHPSSGTVKLSVPLIIQEDGEFPKTPWHSSLALALDGSYRTVHSKDVRDTHTLVYHKSQPYFYREKSALWDWEDDIAVFEPQYPNALRVYPRASFEQQPLLEAEHIAKLRQLAEIRNGPIEVVGFGNSAEVFG